MALEKTIRIKVDASKAGAKIDKLDRKTQKLGNSADKTNNQFGALKASVIAVAAALQVAVIARYADAFTSVQNQIRQTTNSSEELTQRTKDLIDISKRSRVELLATSELYTQLTLSTENLGLSTDELLRITETISKSFAVSGKSAAESAGAIRQLGQAFSAGALRGDEFNSIAEGAPEIMRALQRSLNLTQGELRDLAATGGITAKVLVDALGGAAEVIDKKLADSTMTLALSFQEAETNAIEFIGTNESITSTMESAGKTVIALSENLDLLVTATLTVSSVYGAKLLASLITSTAAKVTATVSTISLAKAEQSAAVSALAVAKAEQAATVSMFNASVGATRGAIASGALATANNALAIASTRAAAANTAMAISTRALSASLAFLGGPLGVLLIAVSALVLFGRGESDAEIKAREFSKTIDDQIDSVKGLDTELKLATASKKAFAQQNDLIAQIQAQKKIVEELAESAENASKSMGQFGGIGATVKISAAKEKLAELNAQLSKVSLLTTEIFNKEQNGGGGDGKKKKVDKVKKEPVFVNTEMFKTESLKAELAKRLEINRAFNNIMIQDFQTHYDKERAIIEFNREADIADLDKDIIDSKLGFQQKQAALDANQKLSDANRQTIQLELQAQQDAQKELHNLELLQIEQDFEKAKTDIARDESEERAEIARNEAYLRISILSGNANAILGAMSALGKRSLKIQKGVAIATSGVAIATGIARANELGFPANIGEIARVVALGAKVMGTIRSTEIGSAPQVGGSFSGGGSSSQTAQRQEPINQSTVVDFRGLEGIADALNNLDPDEVLPVEYTQRIVASLGEYNRLGGG